MVLPEGTDIDHTYLLFSVKDQSPVLGEGLLLGEALLPLKDIVKEDGDVSLKVSLFHNFLFLYSVTNINSLFRKPKLRGLNYSSIIWLPKLLSCFE